MSQDKVYRGTVKQYNERKGYGFIAREDYKQGDIFFHVSDLENGDHNPQQNDEVQFEIAPGRAGKQKAVKVKKLD